MQPCGLEDASLRGAIKLYKALSKRLEDRALTKTERRRVVEQRRCLVDVFGPDVRLDPDTLAMPQWEPRSRSMSVPTPPPGALVVLVGEYGRANKTFFIPISTFEKFVKDPDTGQLRSTKKQLVRFGAFDPATKTRVGGRILKPRVEPGDFDREIDHKKLADALAALAEQIRKLP